MIQTAKVDATFLPSIDPFEVIRFQGEVIKELEAELKVARESSRIGWEMYDKARVLAEGT